MINDINSLGIGHAADVFSLWFRRILACLQNRQYFHFKWFWILHTIYIFITLLSLWNVELLCRTNCDDRPTCCNTSNERSCSYVLRYKAVIITNFAMNCMFLLLLKPLTWEQDKLFNFISIEFAHFQCDSEYRFTKRIGVNVTIRRAKKRYASIDGKWIAEQFGKQIIAVCQIVFTQL